MCPSASWHKVKCYLEELSESNDQKVITVCAFNSNRHVRNASKWQTEVGKYAY